MCIDDCSCFQIVTNMCFPSISGSCHVICTFIEMLSFLSFSIFAVLGPFKINGVPLRRVNQSYVIGTSTKVDISDVNVDKFDDKYFAKEAKKKKTKGEGEFFEAEKEVSLTIVLF